MLRPANQTLPNAPRQVRVEPTAEDRLTTLEVNVPRMDDVWRGVEWHLCRLPNQGTFIGSSNQQNEFVIVFIVRPGLQIRTVIVVYTFTDDLVEVHDLFVR